MSLIMLLAWVAKWLGMLWKKGVGLMQLLLDLKQNLALKMTQEMQQSGDRKPFNKYWEDGTYE